MRSPLPLHGKPHTFAALDGLRGVAAIAVILFHLPGIAGPISLPRAYLAVDFFFLLSGFVLAYAYGDRLDRGWPTRDFLLVRWIRLYPLYALGTLLGLLIVLTPWAWHPQFGSTLRLLVRLVLGLCFLPAFTADFWIFPLNFPSWSILQEFLGNIGHAVFLRRRSSAALALVVLAGAIGTVLSAVRVGSLNFGPNRPYASLAVCRLVFGYVGGLLLYRIWRSRRPRFALPASLSAVLLCTTFALPFALGGLRTELACLFVLFPLLIMGAASAEPGGTVGHVYRLLGKLSYPVYLLHMPLYVLIGSVWSHPARQFTADPSPAVGALYLPLLLALAFAANRFYDAPLRAWLTQHLRRLAH